MNSSAIEKDATRRRGRIAMSLALSVSFSLLASAVAVAESGPSAESAPSVSDTFSGLEGLYDPPRHALLLRIPKISGSNAAMQGLADIVERYQRIKGAVPKTDSEKMALTKQMRDLGVAKVRFYARYGLTARIMSVRASEVDSYLSKWQAYWNQQDRIDATRNAAAIPVRGQKIPTSALQLSTELKQLFALGVGTDAFDRALLANPNFRGMSPDDARVGIDDNSGCEEYYHQDDTLGGGYVIDSRGALLSDRCTSPNSIQVYSCPERPEVSGIPTPAPMPQPVMPVSRNVTCQCQPVLAPDLTETAKCIAK